MVESLGDLNKLCQKPRYKEVGNWMVRYVLRDLALPITWCLLHTSVTANQVTFISLILGLMGIMVLAFQGLGWFWAGVILLQVWYLLDHVDGQIARYRKTASLTGRFYDFMTHHIIHGTLFFSLGVFAFQQTGSFFWILAGFLAAFSIILFNLLQDTKYKTFFEKLASMDRIEILKSTPSAASYEALPAASIFSFLHKLCEIHVVMNSLTLGVLLQSVLKLSLDLRFIFILFYGALVPTLTVTKLSYWIRARKIDAEFEAAFKSSDTL